MQAIFFTGFPGFLGSELVPRVLARSPQATAVCLVQPKFAEVARRRADELARTHRGLAGRVQIVEGDITRPDLGLGPRRAELAAETVEVYHLAAVYDLSVPGEVAERVNVDGTRHTLDFARACPGLSRFHYVSTCYVSGRYAGVYTEDDLERGQTFNNHYESTKYMAEVEVQRAMRAGLPATVYRPAVVVGDSTTGATQKYDGPYFGLQLILRQRSIAFLPVVGDPSKAEFNVVPRDFVLDAITYLSGQPNTAGQVYNLADPSPLTVDQLIDEMSRCTGRRIIRVPLPLGLAKAAIDRVPGVAQLLRIPASSLDYFVHPTRYGTAKTQKALEGSGVRCPRFPEVRAAAGRVRPTASRDRRRGHGVNRFLGRDEERDQQLSFSVKLPDSGREALELPHAEPTGYNLGKSGWITFRFPPDECPPEEFLLHWVEESYRCIATKRLIAQLDSRSGS